MKQQASKDRLLSAAKRGPVGAGMARRGASGSGFHSPRKYGKRDRQWFTSKVDTIHTSRTTLPVTMT